MAHLLPALEQNQTLLRNPDGMSTRLPPVSLIHIGLPKTATTFLQTLWMQDPDICLLRDGLLPMILGARQEGLKESPVPNTPGAPPVQFDTPLRPGQKLVLSNEALSNAYINERAPASRIRSFQAHAAARTKALTGKTKVLLVVREPAAWILSIYNQAIKQGGTDSFRQFVRREQDYLQQSLNFRELFLTWKQHYGSANILILPLELLRDKPERFFTELSRFSGLGRSPDIPREQTINPSLKPGHLDVMRQFNKWVELFRQHGPHRGQLPPELEQALTQIRFATRYMLESPEPDLERRLRRYEAGMRVQRPSLDDIPGALLKSIRASNRKQLKKDAFFGYRDLYA
jgi:hypothetical protein